MQCSVCGGKVEETTVNLTLWERDKLMLIEDVPAAVCQDCGEQYYDEATAGTIKEVSLRGDPVRHISVPVYRLPVPAEEKA